MGYFRASWDPIDDFARGPKVLVVRFVWGGKPRRRVIGVLIAPGNLLKSRAWFSKEEVWSQ